MAATLTSSGITFSTGNSLNDVPWYTGSTGAQTSLPIGAVILSGNTVNLGNFIATINLNNSRTVYVCTASGFGAANRLYSTNTGPGSTMVALSGTWVYRGSASVTDNCGSIYYGWPQMFQRIA